MQFRFRPKTVGLVLLALAVAGGSLVFVTTHQAGYPTTPTTHEGRAWRIGYYEGGPFQNYPRVLLQIVNELEHMGWVTSDHVPPPELHVDSAPLWQWMARHLSREYVEFVEDAYWSANWQDKDPQKPGDPENLRKKNKADVLERLNRKKDIDLMIAMGTMGGQNLANDQHHTPTVVCSTTDPIGAGIIKSAQDSGLDHLHSYCDPDRFKRQIRLFHNICKFKTLGIAFEDTPKGRLFAALDDVRDVASRMRFKILTCHVIDETPDLKIAEATSLKCFTDMAPNIDAAYITSQRGVNAKSLPAILAPLMAHHVPTFSQNGSADVAHGVLFSISKSEEMYSRFMAESIAKIFNGAKPRNLNQIITDVRPKIAINLEAAKRTGFVVPPGLLRVADEIYTKIEP